MARVTAVLLGLAGNWPYPFGHATVPPAWLCPLEEHGGAARIQVGWQSTWEPRGGHQADMLLSSIY
jgi:hypothetical protein